MLTLTRKTDYALLALTHLSHEDGGISSAREMAEEYGVSAPLLMNVMKTLAQQGLVTSIRGAYGGYRLSRSADDITLNSVIEAIEGPVSLFQCAKSTRQNPKAGCERQDHCPISRPARRVAERFRHFLDGVTLREIASNHKRASGEPEASCESKQVIAEEQQNAGSILGQ